MFIVNSLLLIVSYIVTYHSLEMFYWQKIFVGNEMYEIFDTKILNTNNTNNEVYVYITVTCVANIGILSTLLTLRPSDNCSQLMIMRKQKALARPSSVQGIIHCVTCCSYKRLCFGHLITLQAFVARGFS